MKNKKYLFQKTFKTSWVLGISIRYDKDWEDITIQILCFRLIIDLMIKK